MTSALLEEVERRILIVDDEPDTTFSRKFLDELNASVEVVETFGEARAALGERGDNTVIILDLMFPEDVDDGLNFLRELKQSYETIPVIVHTAAPMPDVEETALDAGAEDVLQKAGDPEELRNAIMLASGLEIKRAEVLCEVIGANDRGIRVQIAGEDGWVAEREFDRRFCPPLARSVGSAFWLDTYQSRSEGRDTYTLRSRGVDPAEDLATVASWFDGINDSEIDKL